MNEARQSAVDFLACSVHKALGDDAAIEPRLPSLFEPALGLWQETSAVELDLSSQFKDTPAIGEFDGRVNPGQQFEHKSVRALAGRPDIRSGSLTRRQNAPATIPALNAGPLRTEVVSRENAATTRAPASVPNELAAQPFAQSPGISVRYLSESTQVDEVDLGRPPPVDRVPSQCSLTRREDPSLANEERRARPADAEDGGRGALVPAWIERRFDIPPAFATHPSRSDQARGAPSAAAAAPVVNVTIGRVEVRAISPPAARPRNERPGTQPMSLNDYLKQRWGGR